MGWIPHPDQDLEQLWDINPFYQLLMKSMYSLSVDAEDKGGGGGGGDSNCYYCGPNPNKGGKDQTEH